MEKRAEWPARGREAVSPFPGDILEPFRVILDRPEFQSNQMHNFKLFRFHFLSEISDGSGECPSPESFTSLLGDSMGISMNLETSLSFFP